MKLALYILLSCFIQNLHQKISRDTINVVYSDSVVGKLVIDPTKKHKIGIDDYQQIKTITGEYKTVLSFCEFYSVIFTNVDIVLKFNEPVISVIINITGKTDALLKKLNDEKTQYRLTANKIIMPDAAKPLPDLDFSVIIISKKPLFTYFYGLDGVATIPIHNERDGVMKVISVY